MTRRTLSMTRFQSSRLAIALSMLLTMSSFLSSCCHAFAAQPPLHPVSPMQTELARKAMKFIDASPDPFHAVQTSIQLLKQAGFVQLKGPYKNLIKAGGKYYFTKNKSTLVAFCIGNQYSADTAAAGFKIIGAHTDSPNLRVKPRSKRKSASGNLVQLGVECYGGGLWHTWFDRDLGVSGRVLVRINHGNDGNDDTTIKVQQRLVHMAKPLLRIANLAIHLQTTKEREAFVVNKEDHLSPILAMEVKKQLIGERNGAKEEDDTKKDNDKDSNDDGWTEYQSPALLQILAKELNVQASDIVDFELSLFDVQPAALGGMHNEFIHSARLDNLASCFMAVQALVNHVEQGKLERDQDISMIVLYDHEEVGSTSAVGAASPIMAETMKRVTAALQTDDFDAYDACIQRSYVLSCDQAHAVHPNYASKHEKSHQPKMNQGMVIKRNANQRYATTTMTGAIMREIARKAKLPPIQEFVVRQDCGCGSTIGPVISAATGIRAIDMGCPQLSMHSIRETMGTMDIENGVKLFEAFLEHFRAVDDSIEQ
ncbi:hypothetical protein MPSEU_000414900 [Mayamaea pseudoterrestris]|nr:hypothetical protein MPSEU_000414900 [Mayamaea pseudoterrestris]